MEYKRLSDRIGELNRLYDETKDILYMMEDDCICHFFECEGYKKYEIILDFAKHNNFKRVFDIGCAFGHQSEVFLNSNIEYVGIDSGEFNFWNNDRYKYISKEYPFTIKADKDDLAVSVLCLTWNCYLYENERTLHEQCNQLKKDFKHCLLYMDNKKIEFVKRYYNNYKILDGNFIYFYN